MANTMTRRSFLKGAALTGASASAATLAGCGGSDGGSTTDGGAKKKILRFGQTNAKLGLDMQKSTNSGSSSIADSVFEAPLRWTEDNELVTCLLTEIPTFEDDGVTLHCTLKDNILCHDGSTLTASDVKFTFERMFTPSTAAKSTYMYDLIKGAPEMLAGTATELEGLTVEDDTHFTFVLSEPMVTFVNNLGINYAQIFPQKACEEAGDQWGWGTNCVGTGKYKIVSNDDTTEVVMEKFADYHDGEPALDELDYIFYDDNNTKLMAYKNGDIDWCDLAADQIAQYQADTEVADQITLYDTLGVHFVNLNLKEGMGLEDVRVRQALSLAVNRQELIDTVLNGAGVAATGWLAPQTPGYDSSAELPYDPERAKELLAEAGVSGLKLEAKIRAGVYEKYMTVIQSYWSEIGVELSLQTEDNGVWASDWADGNLQITALAWFPLYADADNHLYTYFYSTNAAGKSSFYDNSEFDDLVSRARRSQDPDERKQLYMEADNLVTRTDFATVPLFWPKNSFVAKPYVKNAKVGNLIYHMFDLDIDTTDESYTTA
ncbi:ABC transporter substrate-binding protein [Thermophilibacter immobilis]|uniref:Twin-arginine translocation signal domain-containing protein n=1 Tax=Thermophilibacter immobilis TaxID=2779519 RepID=A0A7S7M9M3_9ACTN|nr:ABC transporter substrate-binding protein [Thermophilibacter immobilis]QOY61241.1 twin-arginine translocation signal domain-containing protein [Thermophilibacter immobilis]